MNMLKLNLKYMLRSNLNLNSSLLAFIMELLVTLDHTVIRFILRSFGLRSMIPRKLRLVKILPCLNMFPEKKKKKKTPEGKHDSSYSRKSCEGLFHMMRDILTRLDKLDKGHNTAPRVKKAWVRKIDTIHPLRGSGSGFT